ncbi:MAG: 1,4-dihydroxy-2-naphthoate octaprenyltransferase [Marinifilaceae bacterium]
MSKTKIWIKSFRLRTLPLSLSGVVLASLISYANNLFSLNTCIFALTTTLFLQILSNLANDLGDTLKGTDNSNRKGPERAMQTGLISIKEMKNMILVFVLLSVLSGILLIIYSFNSLSSRNSIYMLSLGALAIIAAIKYTLGKKAYGYHAMGDIFVFIFFGLASVIGTYFLHSAEIPLEMFLPATAIGLLSVGVLNMNNIRDIENDKACGKNTIPVVIGEQKAKIYHYTIITSSFICLAIYFILRVGLLSTLPLFILYIPIIKHLHTVYNSTGIGLDHQLKILSLSTFLISIVTGLMTILYN